MRNNTTGFLLQFFLLFAITANAQAVPTPNQQSLVDAEWSFIRMAKEKNTREAFLANVDKQTVVFNGKELVNAKVYYETMQPNESLLSWAPVYTDIAASGDFGYNTGPWDWRPNKNDDKPVAFGQFISVWKKQTDGSWKLAIDLGISHPLPSAENQSLRKSSITTKRRKGNVSDFKNELLTNEKNFIESAGRDVHKTYKDNLSKEAKLFRSGFSPYTDERSIAEGLQNSFPATYTVVDGDVASSGDFGFVYGIASVKISESETKNGAYLRIWKFENGKQWKIIADVLTYQ